MQNIIDNSFKFELVDLNEQRYLYDFISHGSHGDIPKRVMVNQMTDGIYNLGFGDFSIDQDGKESVDDKCRNKNKADPQHILNTALLCGIDFLSTTTNNKIVFFGNTPGKHRLYTGMINARLNDLSPYLIIKGGIMPYNTIWDTQGFKLGIEGGNINLSHLIIEDYDTQKSRDYNFFTFEIRGTTE